MSNNTCPFCNKKYGTSEKLKHHLEDVHLATSSSSSNKDEKVLLNLVIDQSGSMGIVEDETRITLNSFLDEQKKVPGNLDVSAMLFDTEFEQLYEAVDIKDVPAFDSENYRPGGLTALLDAVAAQVKSVENLDVSYDKVIFVVMTDGQENSSRKFNHSQVKELIDDSPDNWQFVFLGAGTDAWAEGVNIGVARNSTLAASSYTAANLPNISRTISDATTSYRMSATATMSDGYFEGANLSIDDDGDISDEESDEVTSE